MDFNIVDFISPRNNTENNQLEIPVDNYLYSPQKNKSNYDFKKETDYLFEKYGLDTNVLLEEIKST